MVTTKRISLPVEAEGTAWKIFGGRVKGITPLLMSNPARSMQAGEEKASRKRTPPPEEEAATRAYISDGVLVVPADAVREAMKAAGKTLRVRRQSLATFLAAGLYILEPYFPILRDGRPLTTWDEIDIRRVVVERKGILRARPLIRTPWEVEVRFLFDAVVIREPGLLVQALSEAGLRQGILDYRPQKGGGFGRFEVVEAWVEPWEEAP